MKEQERIAASKFLSLVLRHRPDKIGLQLDEEGWGSVDELLKGCRAKGKSITLAQLCEIVETSPKQRFAFSDDGLKIRASQGHSVDVELGYQPMAPPDRLFHGTVAASIPSIREEGLSKMNRHHVHLSPDRETATIVGARRGKALILVVRAGEMAAQGHHFYCSANGVWLTTSVPARFIDFPDHS